MPYPFNDRLWSSPTKQGDVGGMALDVSIAVRNIGQALEKLAKATGTDIGVELTAIDKASADLFKSFEDLTGWRGSQ